MKKKSKFMSYILRHCPESIELDMDDQGWVLTSDLVSKSNGKLTLDDVIEIVNTDEKGRYQFNDNRDKIRATQGHSTDKVNITFQRILPPKVLYHGTNEETYKLICNDGLLKPMSRHHVHLSGDIETAQMVGSRRKGTLKIIEVNAERMAEAGYEFYISDNGVYLTETVPVVYFIQRPGYAEV